MNAENQELIKREESHGVVTISIPDEKIEEILQTGGDSDILWVKFNPSGFVLNDRTLPELQGVILDIHPHLIRFEGKTPEKLPNTIRDEDIPEGFERRCDIKMQLHECKIGLSLPKTSFFQLKPYVRYLTNKGLRPEEVVTRMHTQSRSNQYGTFSVIVFECLRAIEEPGPGSPQATRVNQEGSEDSAPVPGNPWA
jgi:hypothetical protein